MIQRLRFTNFRSHQDTTLGLHPITLLLGPVAAGKSNVFKGLLLLQNTVHSSLMELFPPGLGEFDLVRSRWASQTDPIGFEVDLCHLKAFPEQKARYIVKLATAPRGHYVLEESLQQQERDSAWRWVFRRFAQDKQSIGEFGNVDSHEPTMLNLVWHQDQRMDHSAQAVSFARETARSLSSFGYFHFEASQLKSAGEGEPVDRVSYYGNRLPDFIGWAKSDPKGAPVYQAILREMQELLPGLSKINVIKARPDEQSIAFSFEGQNGYIAAPDFSDGTLFTLGLLCIIHGPRAPQHLCIEEPETGLHPGRLRWLFDRLVELAYPPEGRAPIQVLLSTHAPYLVDLFGDMPECVQIVDQQRGRSRVTSLAEIEKAKLHEPLERDEPIGRLWATGLYENL